ncbi:MAG: hypothetical protein KGJ57_19810 [Sphingomonadales bacterium]|nr:hypothetical protein [Sphingomonadales bacterium]MDE2171641.1 hypothetical protein [Sphingomonadales bacterium]
MLVTNGYRTVASPLEIAGLAFEVAGAFVGVDHSADLVIIGDMAADGERKVVQQIEGIARALDVMRSHRPLTTVIVGPRPVGKTLEALAQVGRILPVGEADDPADLRDQLAILLPLVLPETLLIDRDLGAGETLALNSNPLAEAILEASKLGEDAVRDRFYTALSSVFAASEEDEHDDEAEAGEVEDGEAQE